MRLLSADAAEAFLVARSGGRRTTSGFHAELHAILGTVTRVLRASRPGIPIHAAACIYPDHRGLLLPGMTMSGKSTLALALGLKRSASVVSDDMVWLSTDGSVEGFGRPLCLRSGSPLWSSATTLWYAEPHADRMLLLPEDLGAPPICKNGTVDAIVFPVLGRTSGQIAALSPTLSLSRLLGSVVRPIDAREFLHLAEFVAARRSFEIRYNDVDSSLALCDRVRDTAGGPEVAPTPIGLNADELACLGSDVVGVRFDEEVVLVRRSHRQVVILGEWQPGQTLSPDAWGAVQREIESPRHD